MHMNYNLPEFYKRISLKNILHLAENILYQESNYDQQPTSFPKSEDQSRDAIQQHLLSSTRCL